MPLVPLKFAIIMPTYNNEYWCTRCIESVASQTYPHWFLYCIDDASEDGTYELTKLLLQSKSLRGKCRLIRRRRRRGSLANIYEAIHQIDPDTIIVMLDGDDALGSTRVLEHLATIYADPRVWLTYGSFKTDPPSLIHLRPYSKKVCESGSFRGAPFLATHLKTFYAKLFHTIRKEDLTWQGHFFPVLGDMAFMLPMLEMAAPSHIHFMKEILYIYTAANPLSDVRRNMELCRVIEFYLRSRPHYKSLEILF
jgi:glycosyltransferase involved in cell wall biosynthesis